MDSAHATHPNVLSRVEAGRFEGVLDNPCDEVAHTLEKFFDLSWVGVDLQVDALKYSDLEEYLKENNLEKAAENIMMMAQMLLGLPLGPKPTQIRRIRYPKDAKYDKFGKKDYDIDLIDIRIPPEAEPHYQLRYLVFVNKLSIVDKSLINLLRSSMIVISQTLNDLGKRQCRYVMKTEVSAPFTSVKLLNLPLDKLNGFYYKGLFRKFNMEDFSLNVDDLPLKVQGLVDFLKFQTDTAKGEDQVAIIEQRPGLFVANKMPEIQYGLRYEKLMMLVTAFTSVAIEKLYNLGINDTRDSIKAMFAMQTGMQPQLGDPWQSMFRAGLPDPQEHQEISNDEFLSHDIYSVRLPKFIVEDNNFMKDQIFAEYFFNGGNPFSVRKVNVLDDVPNIKEFEQALKGVGLQKLTENGHLFYLDYAHLKDLQYPEIFRNMAGHAPTVLIKKEGSKYFPLGIYVEAHFQHISKRRVFTPDDQPNVWRLAKMHVHAIDVAYFQVFIHLGQAHLMSEPLAVAVYNNLIAKKRKPHPKKDKNPHPLGAILRPYARGLLGINHLALFTLVDDKQALLDNMFTGGVAHLFRLFQEFMKANCSLKGMNPHIDLKNRGFSEEDLTKEYAYGYYSIKLYDMIKNYMLKICKFIYPKEGDVEKDVELKHLQNELQSVKFILGMDLKTPQDVAEFATNHIWTLTAHHSISFSVTEFDAYIPFRPPSLTKPLPLDEQFDKEVDNTYVQESLPFPTRQIVHYTLLTTVGGRMEPSLLETENPFDQHKECEFFKYYEEFHEGLEDLEKEYNAHMEELKKEGRMQFIYLKPSLVENCLAI